MPLLPAGSLIGREMERGEGLMDRLRINSATAAAYLCGSDKFKDVWIAQTDEEMQGLRCPLHQHGAVV